MNDFYVYEYIRLDTNEPFYVGKGHKNRWRRLDREYNPYFMNIINKVPIKSAGKYKGKPLKWKYIKWNHNKKFRISK